MRNIWLLPDYSQSGTINAVEDEAIKPLHELIDLASLPQAIVLGIPEELLEKYKNEDFVYSQFGKQKYGVGYFTCSARAGQDISGRSVCITNLQVLQKNEVPQLPPAQSTCAPESSRLPMQKLVEILSNDRNVNVAATVDMLAAARTEQQLLTFSSETLRRSANPHDWMPKKKDGKGLIKLLLGIACILVFYYFLVQA